MAYKVVIWKVDFNIRDQSSSECSSYIKSKGFAIEYHQEGKDAKYLFWNLSFYPEGFADNVLEKSIGIFTRCKNLKSQGGRTDFDFQLTISLLDRDGNAVISQTKDIMMETCKDSRHHGFSKFATYNWINLNRDKLIVNNQLTFRVEFTLFDSTKVLNVTQNNKTISQLIVYKELFTSGEFSDVTLVSSDHQELKTHRVILMSHSNVFRKMLEKDLCNHRVEIPQFESQVLSELVRFIYTKKAEDIEEIVFDLYRAADHFQILELKQLCHKIIVHNLNLGNVLDSMKFAEVTENNDLMKKCFGLIKNNWGLIRKNVDWNLLTPEQNFMIVDYLCNDIAEVHLSDN